MVSGGVLTEAKIVTHNDLGDVFNGVVMGLVGDIVQVAACLDVGIVTVHGGGDYSFLHNLCTDDGFDATSGSEGVADHALDGGKLEYEASQTQNVSE